MRRQTGPFLLFAGVVLGTGLFGSDAIELRRDAVTNSI